MRRLAQCRCRGFTMVEASIAIVILSVMLIVALNTMGASNANQFRSAERAVAGTLAESLLSDIVQLAYEEPNGTPAFGRESGESANSKTNYDDVDDFNGWSESPPQDRAGAAMTDLSGWSRSVVVEWMTVNDPAAVAASESGLKRITVTVSKNGVVKATRKALKGKAP